MGVHKTDTVKTDTQGAWPGQGKIQVKHASIFTWGPPVQDDINLEIHHCIYKFVFL